MCQARCLCSLLDRALALPVSSMLRPNAGTSSPPVPVSYSEANVDDSANLDARRRVSPTFEMLDFESSWILFSLVSVRSSV